MKRNERKYFDGTPEIKEKIIKKLTVSEEFDIKIKEKIISDTRVCMNNTEFNLNSEKILYNIQRSMSEISDIEPKNLFFSEMLEVVREKIYNINQRFSIQYKIAATFSIICISVLMGIMGYGRTQVRTQNIKVNITSFEKQIIVNDEVILDSKLSMNRNSYIEENKIKIKFY